MRNKERKIKFPSLIKNSTLLLSIIAFMLLTPCLSNCNHLCKECDGNDCKICKKGHGLTEGACYSCLIEKCEDCSGDPKKCVSCRSYHYYQDQLEECKRCGFGCKECQSDRSCEKCGFIFKKKNSNKGECRISVFLVIMILIALIIPCVFVWTLTYCLCLKSRPPKFDENGNMIKPKMNTRRTEKRFTGKQEKPTFKKKIQTFFCVDEVIEKTTGNKNKENLDGMPIMTTDR